VPANNGVASFVDPPAAGEVSVTSGAELIVQLNEVGDPSLPAASLALTENVCVASERFVYVTGLVHVANAAPSRAQLVVDAASALNANVAVRDGLGSEGCASSDGALGGTVSTVQPYDVATLSFPAPSTDFTANVWPPSERLEYVAGFAQDANAPPSSAQRKPTPGSESEKLKLAVVAFVTLAGRPSIDGAAGAVVSTTYADETGALSLPAGSRAFTRKVCVPAARFA